MTSKKAKIAVGLLIILAALLVTGTSYKDHGSISLEIIIAFGLALIIGLTLIVLGGKKS